MRFCNAFKSLGSTWFCKTAQPITRYKTPLSKKCQCSFFANNCAIVPFPEPDGPSIVMTGIFVMYYSVLQTFMPTCFANFKKLGNEVLISSQLSTKTGSFATFPAI